MSTNKEIKIKWVSDDNAIDQSLAKLQAKMQAMQKSSAQMTSIQSGGGVLSRSASYAQASFQRSSTEILQKEQRELDVVQKKELSGLLSKQRELINIKKAEGAITAEKQKQIDLLKEEVALRSKKIMDIENTKKQIEQSLKDIGAKPEAGGTGGGAQGAGGGAQGAGGGAQGAGGTNSFMNFLKGVGVAGIIAGGLNAYATIGGYSAERQGAITKAEGGASRGLSRDMREQMGGRGSDAFFWSQERKRAAEITQDQFANKRSRDMAGAAGSALVGTVAGAAAGALALSFLGPAGVVAGGVIGGASGAVKGMSKEGMTAFDKEKWTKENMVSALRDREANEQALMMQDPRKMIGREHFMKNVDKYSQFQRRQGLSDVEAFGGSNDGTGMIRGMMREAGQMGGGTFGEDAIMGNIQSLQGASGLTKSRELAGRSAGYQRQMGIENAGSVMGQMMGRGAGDIFETESSFKKIMAEAVSMGVDTTKMSTEMQNFTQMAAEITTRGGGFSETAAKQLAGAAGDFGKGALDAAGTEFGEFQQRAKAGGGIEGQMGMGFFQSGKADKAFGKDVAGKIRKDPALMNMLNQMSVADLEKNPKLLEGITQQLTEEGGDKEATKKQFLEGMTKQGLFKQSRTEKGEQTLEKYRSSLGTDKEPAALLEAAKARTSEFGQGFTQKGTQQMEAALKLSAGVESQGGAKELGAINEALGTSTGRAAEGEKSAQATGDKMRIGAMSESMEKYIEASSKTTEASAQISAQFNALSKMMKDSGGDMETTLKKLNEQLQQMSDQMTQQGHVSSKPSGH